MREPKTILENVESVEPGNFLIYKNKQLIKKNYFNLKDIFTKKNNTIDIEIENSVMKHYTSEVSSCLFLSSGIDSNLILAVLKKNNIEIPTISISFENLSGDIKISDESEKIKKICTEHKVQNHHSIKSTILNFAKKWINPQLMGLTHS